MTPQEIDAMEAGRELDALVAEKVMGDAFGGRYVTPNQTWSADPQPYSSDIAVAWQVVEELNKRPAPGQDIVNFPRSVAPRWTYFYDHVSDVNIWSLTAEQAALHICRTALKAVS